MEQQIKTYEKNQDEFTAYRKLCRKKCSLSSISKAFTRFTVSLMVIFNVYAVASPVAFTIKKYVNDFMYTDKDYKKIIIVDIFFLVFMVIQALIFYCFIRKYPKRTIEKIEIDNDNMIITCQENVENASLKRSSTEVNHKCIVKLNEVHKIIDYQAEMRYEIILDMKRKVVIGDYFGDGFRDDILMIFSDKYIAAAKHR